MRAAGTAGGERDLFRTLAKALLLAAALVVALWFVHEVRRALLVLAVAGIVGVFLNAPVTWLERKGISRPRATLAVLLGLLAIAGALGWLVLPRLAQEVPRLLERTPELVTGVAERLSAYFGESPEVERQLSRLVDWVVGLFRGMWQHAGSLVGAFVLGIFVLAMVLYMLADPRPLLRTYLLLLPARLREPGARAFARSSEMIVWWAVSNVVLGTIRAVATFFFLQFMGVPGALLWSLLAFVTALIPQIGFYLMAIPPVVVSLSLGFRTALWVALFFWAFDTLLGNFVAPRIRGTAMDLHPAYLLAVTLLMAFAFGPVGVLIAAPVAGVASAYLDEFYLAGRSGDERLGERVESMLQRES